MFFCFVFVNFLAFLGEILEKFTEIVNFFGKFGLKL